MSISQVKPISGTKRGLSFVSLSAATDDCIVRGWRLNPFAG